MSGHMVKKEVTSEGEVGGQGDTCIQTLIFGSSNVGQV